MLTLGEVQAMLDRYEVDSYGPIWDSAPRLARMVLDLAAQVDAARSEERAAIVAWLHSRCIGVPAGIEAILSGAAGAIERGEHRREP